MLLLLTDQLTVVKQICLVKLNTKFFPDDCAHLKDAFWNGVSRSMESPKVKVEQIEKEKGKINLMFVLKLHILTAMP